MSKPTIAIYGIKDRNFFEYPAYVHDHNLCVMQDGKILQYLQLERYSRRKYDNRLDWYIEDLIDKKIIDCPKDFDLVCVNDFVGNAFVSQNGRLRFVAVFLEMQKGNEIKLQLPYLCNVGLQDCSYEVSSEEIKRTAELLMQHKIVGVCNGAAEIGPRALGNRSLIALADSREVARKLSMDVKKREWYRPVAPIVLLENAHKVAEEEVRSLSRFMLMDFTVREEYRKKIAGVVHANNTARIQTLSCEEENPFMFRLLSYLYEKYGVLALVNTSFNAKGEPIVHTAVQALESAQKMKIDGVVINGKLHTL